MAAIRYMHINSLILDYGSSTVNLHAHSGHNVINNLNVHIFRQIMGLILIYTNAILHSTS